MEDSDLVEDRREGVDGRPLGDINDVIQSIKGCRTTVENLLRTDPDFPAPITISNKRQWFLDEIEEYKASRPRRRYADHGA